MGYSNYSNFHHKNEAKFRFFSGELLNARSALNF
jgi:hypothetical protein